MSNDTDKELATPATHVIVELRTNNGLICNSIALMMKHQGWRVNTCHRTLPDGTKAWVMNAYHRK